MNDEISTQELNQSRGYLSEFLLTKLHYTARRGDWAVCIGDSPENSSEKSVSDHGKKLVGINATMPNVTAVAN